jgi:Ca-activated chloride channel family protein
MATSLDVLIRIIPPAPEVHFVRPPINLGLVLDHSGSMSTGRKMAHAREAAVFAVQQLLPTDRVSVTIFDDTVKTIVPNAPATDRAGVIRLLNGVQPGGSTALHAGWAEGGAQVGGHRIAEGLNRVILLSDGLANVGLTDPNAIAGEVKALSRKQVTSTTMGVGSDYNEDLMEAMATSGDGNYYYIEDPRQLPDIFQTELQGLMATSGQKVSLGLEPQNGVTVSDVLNDLEKNKNGRLMLSNLIAGIPILVAVRLNVPPFGATGDLCRFRLAWDDPKGGGRQSHRASLTLPAVPAEQWDCLPDDHAVLEQVALLMAARAKKEAAQALDRGDMAGTRSFIGDARMYTMSAPMSMGTTQELEEIAKLETVLDEGDFQSFRKESLWQRYKRGRSRRPPEGPPPAP